MEKTDLRTEFTKETKARFNVEWVAYNDYVEWLEQRLVKLLTIPPVSGWHFLPEMPEINKEVLVAVKYDNEPVQAFWTGKEWKGSFLVRDNMADGFVRDESYKHIQEWIYAWAELPKVPPIPEPF